MIVRKNLNKIIKAKSLDELLSLQIGRISEIKDHIKERYELEKKATGRVDKALFWAKQRIVLDMDLSRVDLRHFFKSRPKD